MALTRRQVITAAALAPVIARVGTAYGKTPAHPATANRNRLVVIHLAGGNDGLNTVIPTAGRNYDVYSKVRPQLAYAPDRTLSLGHGLGLNPALKALHRLYQQGRVAIVQGVDYPDHSYSHFTSSDIWHSGEPGRSPDSGWLGRHLDRAGVGSGELRGVGIGHELPLMLRGRQRAGIQIASLAAARFGDGTGAVADARHDALALFDHHAKSEPLRRFYGGGARQAVDLVDVLSKAPAAESTGIAVVDSMLTARSLLGLDLGVECVFVQAGNYDTHTGQRGPHEARLGELDNALEAFFYGTVGGQPKGGGVLPPSLAARTVVVVVSEFGRRIGENGIGADAGTDHGAAAPVLVIGPAGAGATGCRLVPGVHGDHPSMGTVAAPADNLLMTTDVRRLYQSLLTSWLGDPDPLYDRLGPLPGLFR